MARHSMSVSQGRRNFLKGAACAAAGAWLGPRRAGGAGCDPDNARGGADPRPPARIVDTHVHFYDPSRPQGVPWPAKGDAVLYRTVLPKHFHEVAGPLGVGEAVVIEASAWLADNDWVLDLVKDDPSILAVVGHVDPGRPEFKEDLARLAANPLFRGVRVDTPTLADGLGREAFVDDLGRLADAGLSLDVVGGPDLLPLADRLADKLPGLRVVIDHLPMDDPKEPDRRDAAREALRRLARRENVFAKVSAVVRRAAPDAKEAVTDPAFYKPLLDPLWDRFGPARLFYGSNWPVSDLVAPYATVLKVIREYVTAKPAAEMEGFFWKNAKTFYRWPERKG